MGAAVIAVVFLAGLVGVPSIFGHGDAHAKSPVSQQPVAAVQAPTQLAKATQLADANLGAATAAANTAIDHP
jgi:hypothetical protein